MGKFLKGAVVLLTLAGMWQASVVLAQDGNVLLGGGQPTSAAGWTQTGGWDQPAGSGWQPPAARPGECLQAGAPGSCPRCEECPLWGLVLSAAAESFKGIADGSMNGNYGGVFGLNAGIPILASYGLGWQAGLSYGAYDADGNVWEREQTQQQVFVTTGFFHKARDDQRVSFGVVYDWMFNNIYGAYDNDPYLGQWRGQIEYAFGDCNAIGVWGCLRDLGTTQLTVDYVTVRNRPISQANLFWHHKYAATALDSWVWLGIPEHDRLDTQQGGSLGDWTIGFSAQAPMSEQLALYVNVSHMHPSASACTDASIESTWNLAVGLAWYVGGGAMNRAINGKCWTPYLPLANNSSFLVDQDPTNILLH
jgi:hypothetical protein